MGLRGSTARAHRMRCRKEMNQMKTTMRKSLQLLLGASFSAGAVALLSPSAEARSIGAWSGNPLDGTTLSCFREDTGGVKGLAGPDSSCVIPFGFTPRWEVSLPIESAGTYTVTFAIRGNSVSGPSCLAVVANQLSGFVGASASATSASNSFALKSVTSPSVPAGGYLYAACDNLVDNLRGVGSINWTQP